jgi:hypothetical protein
VLDIAELNFVGDQRPYIINNQEYKFKNAAKEAFKEFRKTIPIDICLDEKDTIVIFNIMDRYYRLPAGWRKYRPFVQGVRYTEGHKWPDLTFFFNLNESFPEDEDLITPRIYNPSVMGSCLCFGSPNVHGAAHNSTYVAKMFRSAVEDQIFNFRINSHAQSGIHEIHHADITFKNIVLSFMNNVMKINDRDKFEKEIRSLGKYTAGEGQIFNPNIPRAITIRDAFAAYHQKYAKLIVTLKKPHREETSEEIKFNTSLRHKIKETE